MFKDRDRETILVIGVGVLAIGIVAVFLIFSPTGGDFGPRDVAGPSEVRSDVVDAHAAQFDEDLADRTAGSQEEQAAATYILGIMQQNGYVVRLDSVPVSNLVNSTNLIAMPPGLDEPDRVVVVPYDVAERNPDPFAGETLGVFLETARAMNVSDPEHTTAWVAIGAENVETDRTRLGARRLIRFMLDEGWDPSVLRVSTSEDFATVGDEADAFRDAFRAATGEEPPEIVLDTDIGLYREAGFQETIVLGEADDLGPTMLEFFF